jgi:hypothetical protein
MHKRRGIHVFFLSQAIFFLLLGFVFLLGDHSQPRVVQAPTALVIGQSLIISFDRPIDERNIQEHFVVSQNGRAVPGAYSWAGLSVAFTPTQPFTYSVPYKLSVSGIRDIEGRTMLQPFSVALAAVHPQLLYLSNGRLERYDISTRQSTALTPAEQHVTDYAVDGTGVIIAYVNGQGSGLAYLSTDGRTVQRIASDGREILDLQICDTGAEAVAYVKNSVGTQAIVAFELHSTAPESTLLNASAVSDTSYLFCSAKNGQFLYQNLQGEAVVASTNDVSQKQDLGSFALGYGFTPAGDGALVGNFGVLGAYERSVYLVGGTAFKQRLGNPAVDTSDPAYDPAGSRLVVSEPTGLALYPSTGSTQLLTTVPNDAIDAAPIWSPDGRYLAYVRVTKGLPQDDQYVTGELKVLGFGTAAPADLGVVGSDVQWLP